jgi:hypothetical protein
MVESVPSLIDATLWQNSPRPAIEALPNEGAKHAVRQALRPRDVETTSINRRCEPALAASHPLPMEPPDIAHFSCLCLCHWQRHAKRTALDRLSGMLTVCSL